jgi:hypothetical protein
MGLNVKSIISDLASLVANNGDTSLVSDVDIDSVSSTEISTLSDVDFVSVSSIEISTCGEKRYSDKSWARDALLQEPADDTENDDMVRESQSGGIGKATELQCIPRG